MRPKRHATKIQAICSGRGSTRSSTSSTSWRSSVRRRLGLDRRRDRAAKALGPEPLEKAPRRQAGPAVGREPAGGACERRAADPRTGAGHGRHHGAAQGRHLPDRCQTAARRDPGALWRRGLEKKRLKPAHAEVARSISAAADQRLNRGITRVTSCQGLRLARGICASVLRLIRG